MKFVRKWKWEHLWLVYSVIAFFFLPWIIAWVTVPHLAAVIAGSPLICPESLWPKLS